VVYVLMTEQKVGRWYSFYGKVMDLAVVGGG
jgi:hypothetical protein